MGSAQHLKSRFGRDYTMIIKTSTNADQTDTFKLAVAATLAGSVVISDSNLELTYSRSHIRNQNGLQATSGFEMCFAIGFAPRTSHF